MVEEGFTSPRAAADEVMWSVIMANKDFTVAQILGASDTAIQANVDAVVDHFAV